MTSRDSAKDFLERMRKRNPTAAAAAEARLRAKRNLVNESFLESSLEANVDWSELMLETVVRDERPVLLVNGGTIDTNIDLSVFGAEAKSLVDGVKSARSGLEVLLPRIGRIDVRNFPGGASFVGTAWFIAEDILVTNRHVAQLIAAWDGAKFVFHSGTDGEQLEAAFSTAYDLDPDPARTVKIERVLYIEPKSGPDIAFLSVKHVAGSTSAPIPIATSDVGEHDQLYVLGYPARATAEAIPDQALMEKLFQRTFDKKRVAPGYPIATPDPERMQHDCATLGGNSGSVVVAGGRAVGLHFAGLYRKANYAVHRRVLAEFVAGKRWERIVVPETTVGSAPPPPSPDVTQPPAGKPPAPPTPGREGDSEVEVLLPIRLRISLDTPIVPGAREPIIPGAPGPIVTPAAAQAALRVFWANRPLGVIAARIGFEADGDRIGDQPFIAASVSPPQLAATRAAGPKEIQGVPVRYLPATVDEQIASIQDTSVELEAAARSISYDDDARTGAEFSFDPVEEHMKLILHVGPERSWEVLEEFLTKESSKTTISSMYEFGALHIVKALGARLDGGGRCHLALDNATFAKNDEFTFNPRTVFAKLAADHDSRFERIVVPEGKTGLIANSYHMKVTVRGDDIFWLSSGNWKSSSQPMLTPAEIAGLTTKDVNANREWHVVVENAELAKRLRAHIQQDIVRSGKLGGKEVPTTAEERRRELEEEAVVFVPNAEMLEATPQLRRPPSKVLAALSVEGTIRAQPLLTPDQEGRVYCRPVLKTIRGAKKRLWFQIPYIAIARNPDEDRGMFDKLLDTLVEKLISLDDARLILRVGQGAGSKFSSPTHVAWFLKSRGVDIDARVRGLIRTHTKGMIVDDDIALVGSHNWSPSGVTLNRDASLLFKSSRVASYYAEAFDIDWKRARHINPNEFVPTDEATLEAAAEFVPISLSRLPADD